MVKFNWCEMNDETFNQIKREGTRSSVEVLAMNSRGAILVGRIHKHEVLEYGYTLTTYLGGGFNNVTKFVKITDLTNEEN